ncbi:PREDICTED: F-box/FBD/LRR-repeat protein At1g13570-like isoform X1 [Nicotiana attenuata]|uniref:F-box/FBD/LRR-repeat protein At1g13570-like isoform X1 n=1 Tax=Nicotiana attenuata TaxID=49451 RepID=UPI000905604F|nr:PREDICTED: F-box/FBD/LRR-repeat protein At1g13570-like isoform X1 [Nicotiana attenuata]
MLPEGRKHCQGLPPDVLINLPDNVIDVILMCLPCKDGVRTSVLSKKWRYHWCRLAKFELDESLWRTQKDRLYPTVRLAKIVYQLLTHHEGPITKFKLRIAHADLKECPEIDNFIYFLSRKGIQHLVLHLPEDGIYKLPSSLFICSQLRHLNLHDCLIHPPPAFKGFDRLVSLELCRVTISSELLGSLISHCPLLEQFVLKISESLNIIEINAPMLRSFDFTGSISSICLKNVPLMAKASLMHEGSSREAENFDYAKFFESCSSLEHLLLNFKYGKFFADETPTRLPFDLNRLKHLRLSNIVVKESYKLSCALCLIRSSPYLEYLEIEIYGYYDGAPESLELERFSDITFNHLREVTLIKFGRTTLEMQLIKLLLAKSPMLVKMLIYPVFNLETTSEILDELSKFGHASPKAVIVYYDKKEVIVNFS